jgi:hypothetical protein
MNKRSQKVVAKYLGNDEEDLPQSWMENLQDKTEAPTRQRLEAIKQFSEGVQPGPDQLGKDIGLGDGIGEALIDSVPDAMSLNKSQERPTENHNDQHTPVESQPYWVDKPTLFEEDQGGSNALPMWMKSREHPDDTTGTAFSPSYMNWQKYVPGARCASSFAKEAATIQQIVDGNKHRKRSVFDEESRKVQVNSASSEEQKQKGLFVFKCLSPGSKDQHTSVLQFLKDKGAAPSGPAGKKLVDHEILVGCTCPAFLFWGAQYYAVREKYMYMDMFRPSFVEPGDYLEGKFPAERGKGATYCKHLKAVFDNIGSMGLDEAFTDQLEESIVKVKDPEILKPLFDSTTWISDHGIWGRDSLRYLVRSKKIPKDLQKEVDDLSRKSGAGSHVLENFMNTTWLEWGQEGPEGEKSKVDFVESMVQAPAVLIWILVRDFQESGQFDSRLFEKAYSTLDKVLNLRSIENVEEPEDVKE